VEDRFKRVTKAQLELWLADPVTKAYHVCLSELARKTRSAVSDGSLIDSSNNDRSMNSVHSALGMATGYENASKFVGVFSMCELVEKEKDQKETNH